MPFVMRFKRSCSGLFSLRKGYMTFTYTGPNFKQFGGKFFPKLQLANPGLEVPTVQDHLPQDRGLFAIFTAF